MLYKRCPSRPRTDKDDADFWFCGVVRYVYNMQEAKLSERKGGLMDFNVPTLHRFEARTVRVSSETCKQVVCLCKAKRLVDALVLIRREIPGLNLAPAKWIADEIMGRNA
ncbi:MAG: hypothetical protein EBY17_25125 [Acidobacteriia bacterium]|nr:hypothetical protein [Terriglobia bacterium]